jgi:curved DNA-binding protein CbpA
MADPIDAYRVLQVDPDAEDEVIRAAYRRLARKYHPDVPGGPPDASARMAAINAAWALVATPRARAAYDQSRSEQAGARLRGATNMSRPGQTASGAGRHPAAPGARSAPGGPASGGHPASPPPETVSRDWTSGRSTVGGGFDESMRSPQGQGAAGPPPGRPSGSVLNFGRYSGWSLGEIARRDIEYIEWLDRTPIGRTYREELDAILRAAGRRQSASTDATDRRGLFRRR